MTDFHVIIPARLQSTRLQAKALKIIGDRTMIEHVCHQAAKSKAISITVATDDQQIQSIVEKAGFQSVITRLDHPSGSDRVFEAAEKLGLDDAAIIVNVQGDEPFIPPENISLVASLLKNETSQMATLCCPIESASEVLDPNAVKVIFNNHNKAIYFSRSPIPFDRNSPVADGKKLSGNYYRHIGIYAYRKKFLQRFIQWPPSRLEQIESLEQLRVLENGESIAIDCLATAPPQGVDTQHDLEAARRYFSQLVSNH